ncbi:MAG: AraC family transcriptional regulator [Acidobacteriota bacterium]
MSEFDTTHYRGRQVGVGSFECRPSHPRFADTGPIDSYICVFPRTSVSITHAGKSSVVADANVVMFYNRNQEYRRGPISLEGDRCDWFMVSPEAVVDAVRPYDPAVIDRPERPFGFRHGPCTADVYLKQRLLLESVRRTSTPDSLWVEESVHEVLRCVVAARFRAVGRAPARPVGRATRSAHAELAEGARSLLATRFDESLSLDEIARRLYTSPFHLSRVFRQQTGSTLHAYRNQLRLRAALDRVTQPDQDLSDLAFALGYSGHSHFTQAFRRCFGLTPSRLRREPRGTIRSLRRRLRVE